MYCLYLFCLYLYCVANARLKERKIEPFDKTCWRPVNILPLLSKIYEKVINKQASNFRKSFFI